MLIVNKYMTIVSIKLTSLQKVTLLTVNKIILLITKNINVSLPIKLMLFKILLLSYFLQI